MTFSQIIDDAKAKCGATAIRLSCRYGMEAINFVELEADLDELKAKGYKVVFNPFHNWQDHTDYFGSLEWIMKWRDLATRYKNDSRIYAFELFNEAFPSTWHTSVTSVAVAQQKIADCVDAIRLTGDAHPIIVPDHETMNDYGWTMATGTGRQNTMQSVHAWLSTWAVSTYGSGIGFFNNFLLPKIQRWENSHPTVKCYIGEFGSLGEPPANPQAAPWTEQAAFDVEILNWAVLNNRFASWWLYNWNRTLPGEIGKVDQVIAASNYKPTAPSAGIRNLLGVVGTVLLIGGLVYALTRTRGR